tara:strand:- start:15707 stop:16363 length:657 start_codon:yes stop_codon:yes gene_type:complete
MSQNIKRLLSSIIYVSIMWFGTSYSEISCSLLFLIILIICLYEMYKLRKGKTKIIAYSYIIAPFLLIHLFFITDSNYIEKFDPGIILFMYILTWTFDTFAYIIGTIFGNHKILPSISPKKSWEGLLGGTIFCVIVSYLCYDIFVDYSSRFRLIELNKIIIASIALPFTATLGDFTASYYKRLAKVKDSGNIIPGHGGILDRMDAFTITIPVFYLIFNI